MKIERSAGVHDDAIFLRSIGVKPCSIDDAAYQARMLDQDRYSVPCEEFSPVERFVLRALGFLICAAVAAYGIPKLAIWIGGLL